MDALLPRDNPAISDVLGRSMLAFINNGPVPDIQILLNDQEDDPMPVDIFFRHQAAFSELEKLAMSRASGRVLDLGAGAGCHSLFLQDQGLEVTAMERSSMACEVMRMQGVTDVRCQDFFAWTDNERFDTILLMMNGFGMAGSLERTPNFLQKVKSHLRPGGIIIGDSTDISYMKELWKHTAPGYIGDVRFKLQWESWEEEFDWVYLDETNLQKAGSSAGLDVQILGREASHNFLVQMKAD